MISGKDIYNVLAGIVPLYVAMFLAYGSIRWWKIFTPDQCSGINRFVAVFAVPLLSFHFISKNNPYIMNFKFIAADSLQKVVILVVLFLWQIFTKYGSLEWMITLFSLSTLPNTLVMGIPLLKAMYGDFSASLMVQIVVLQSVIWYTLMLVMFEYRGAKLLINEQFPDTAGSITSVRVDPDVLSLNGREPLQADAEVGDDGKLHVVVRRSSASSSVFSSYNKNISHGLMPRVSNMSGVEIYSVQSTPRASSFDHTDFYPMFASNARGSRHGDTDSFSGDVFSVHSLKERNSNFEEEMKIGKKSMGRSTSRELGGAQVQITNSSYHRPTFIFPGGSTIANKPIFQKENASSAPKSNDHNEIAMVDNSRFSANGTPIFIRPSRVCDIEEEQTGNGENKRTQMPPASVMTKLIIIMVWRKLIRNPNTYASLLGLVWSLISFRFHIKMPTIVSGSIAILSDAGLGMAMFSLGLFMALQPKMIGCGKRVATFAMAVRFLIGPAVIAATSIAVGLRGDLLHVSIVQAALPQGIVPFVFAKEYNVHADILSTAVIFGMVMALPITILYYILLGL